MLIQNNNIKHFFQSFTIKTKKDQAINFVQEIFSLL